MIKCIILFTDELTNKATGDKLMDLLRYTLYLNILVAKVLNLDADRLSCNSHIACSCNETLFSCYFTDTIFTLPGENRLSEDIDTIIIQGHSYTLSIPRIIYYSSWATIKRLEVTGSRKNLTLTYNFMKALSNLRVLRLRNSNLIEIEKFAFSNLNQLMELDLSNNSFLHIREVENGLEEFNSTTLEIFNISSVHNAENMRDFTITKRLFFPLSSVKILDISWTRAIRVHASFGLMPNIISYNMSGTFILGPTSCFATINRLRKLEVIALDYWPTLARGGEVPFLQYNSKIEKRESIDCPPTPFIENGTGCVIMSQSVKQIYMRHIDSNSFFLSIERGFCVKTNNIEFFSVRGMKISEPINGLFGLHKLRIFDMSYLRTYFTTDTLSDMPALEILLTPGNNLKEIEQKPYFEKAFANNKKLKRIDLRENELAFIPSDIFSQNTLLEVIDLSWNRLQYINLNLTLCLQLQKLSVANNRLKTVDSVVIYHLDWLQNNKTNNAMTVEFNIVRNDFVCTCENLHFVRWIQTTDVNITNKQILFCENTNSETETVVNVNVELLENNCSSKIESEDKLFIYILIGVLVFLFILTLTVFVLWLIRRRNFCLKCHQHEADMAGNGPYGHSAMGLEEIRTSETHDNLVFLSQESSANVSRKPHYIVFLAYCHEDRDFVTDKLYSPLEQCLSERLPEKNKDTLTLLYDKNFLPGEDLVKICRAAVYESYVTVAIVSENFLRSSWCSYEMRTALEANIPVIPLYLTKCEDESMTGILKYIYDHKVRLLWPQTTLNSDTTSEELETIKCLANSIVAYVKKHDSGQINT